MPAQFQHIFDPFIESIGGKVIPEGEHKSADYLFASDKIVAELKTLEEDPLDEHRADLVALFKDWSRRGYVRVFGTATLDLQRLPLQLQREWLDLLEAPIEAIIRKANRQIRSTKSEETLPDAKGLLIIVNDGNMLHTAPETFMTHVARMLQKRRPNGERKFPEIRGVIYFSYRVPVAGESRLFWNAGTLEPAIDSDLRRFQTKLREEWFRYFAKLAGQLVLEG